MTLKDWSLSMSLSNYTFRLNYDVVITARSDVAAKETLDLMRVSDLAMEYHEPELIGVDEAVMEWD